MKHLFAIGSLLTAGALFTACAVDPDESNPADEETPGAEPQAPNCCEAVYKYKCPDNNRIYSGFDLPYCGPTQIQAENNCNNACVATCVYLGEFNLCP